MANYRLVKYCRMCKVRFVVDRSRSREHYCEACTKKYLDNQAQENEEKKEESE